MVGLPRPSASYSGLFLLCQGLSHFIIAVVTEAHNHIWNLVERGRGVKCLQGVCRAVLNNSNRDNDILARRLPAALSEKLSALKTSLFKKRIPALLVALKILE